MCSRRSRSPFVPLDRTRVLPHNRVALVERRHQLGADAGEAEDNGGDEGEVSEAGRALGQVGGHGEGLLAEGEVGGEGLGEPPVDECDDIALEVEVAGELGQGGSAGDDDADEGHDVELGVGGDLRVEAASERSERDRGCVSNVRMHVCGSDVVARTSALNALASKRWSLSYLLAGGEEHDNAADDRRADGGGCELAGGGDGGEDGGEDDELLEHAAGYDVALETEEEHADEPGESVGAGGDERVVDVGGGDDVELAGVLLAWMGERRRKAE